MGDDTKTASILQRVPAILAVTANSFGLSWQAGGTRPPQAAGQRRRSGHNDASVHHKPAAQE